MSTLYQLWRFENVLRPGRAHQASTTGLYVPHVGLTTGDLDVHDVAVAARRPAGLRQHAVRLPRHASSGAQLHAAVAAALREQARRRGPLPPQRPGAGGRRSRATSRAVSRRDVADGWRDRRSDGGWSRRASSGERRCTGLSMPHSPRLYRGRLWLLNSGTGELGTSIAARGKFEPLAFCPGYLRGLAFVGDYAVVGLSLPRREQDFEGLALEEAWPQRGAGAALRAAGDRPAERRRGPLAADRGHGARALRRRGAAGRAPPDGARLQDRRDPAG